MKVLIGAAIAIVSLIVGAIIGGVIAFSELPPQRIGFTEPSNWAYIPDSSKVAMTVAQQFIMFFSKQFYDRDGVSRRSVDTVLYIMEFDFEVATLDCEQSINFITRVPDYRAPVLYINPQAVRMSQGAGMAATRAAARATCLTPRSRRRQARSITSSTGAATVAAAA